MIDLIRPVAYAAGQEVDAEVHAGTLRNDGGNPGFTFLWCFQAGADVVSIFIKNRNLPLEKIESKATSP